MKIINIERFENFLNEYLADRAIHDVKEWIDDVLDNARNGNSDYELSPFCSKDNLPHLIRVDYTPIFDDNNENVIEEILEF